MKKTKTQKGITLIALIITIVVLMLLAAVAISSIQNDGIIAHVNNAIHKYREAQNNEQIFLNQYENFLNNGGNIGDDTGDGGEDPLLMTVKEAQTKGVLSTTSNTEVYDEYGNKVVVPAGFKITEDADTVPEGIVIEDATYTGTIGSQFVWIPVGNVKDSTGTKTINLGRYVFADGNTDYDGDEINETAGSIVTSLSVINPKDQLKETSTSTNYYFTEALKGETVNNKQARDIEAFISSAKTKGGYYIGRYEARTNNTTGRSSSSDNLTIMTTIKTNAVYNYVTQAQALERSQSMYGDANETKRTFSSDLINSFAWDTAIVFIQAFADNDYSIQSSLNTGRVATTGTQGITDTTKHDKVCNIWDMASNCREFSTESCNYVSFPCVCRGSFYDVLNGHFTSWRYRPQVIHSDDYSSFRPLLYVAL